MTEKEKFLSDVLCACIEDFGYAQWRQVVSVEKKDDPSDLLGWNYSGAHNSLT